MTQNYGLSDQQNCRTTITLLIVAVTVNAAISFMLVSVSASAAIAQDLKQIDIVEPSTHVQSLKNGSLLLNPEEDTMVETPHGCVSVGAGSMALVVLLPSGLAVYDLFAKGGIALKTKTDTVAIMPGYCAVLTSEAGKSFEELNPCPFVGYRNISSRLLRSGRRVYEGEYAVMTLASGLPPMQSLIHSENPNARKAIAKMKDTDLRRNQLKHSNKLFVLYVTPSVKESMKNEVDR